MDRRPFRTLIGACSWTDRSLISSGLFYPRGADSAEARLRFYASEFPIVEVDSSYYAIPSRRTAGLWTERTPPDFTFDIKSYGLFTHHPTAVLSLPGEIREALSRTLQSKANVYYKDVPQELKEEAWSSFREALLPLDSAGKLGVVLFQFPPWFLPGEESRQHILSCQAQLPQYSLAVEFRNHRWLEEDSREYLFSFLRENRLAFVCVDGPQGFASSVPPIAEATADTAVVRFHGRNRDTWEKRGIPASERFDYYYASAELMEWTPGIRHLQERAPEVHLLMNTNSRDQGIVNARLMGRLLEE